MLLIKESFESASTLAEAQVALAAVAFTFSGWRSQLKVADCLAEKI